MATIRKRGSGWQAQIRRIGNRPLSKTFPSKADALTWARAVESEVERGLYVDRSIAEQTTLVELLARYETEIIPTLRGHRFERYRLARLQEHFGPISVARLNSTKIASFRDSRLKEVGPESVKHELGLLNRVLKRAHFEWGIVLPYGVPTVQNPKVPRGRKRRLEPGGTSEERLLHALRQTSLVQAMVRFALETAMRRGEIVAMRWEHLDSSRRLLRIPKTKTDTPRTIPLSTTSRQILGAIRIN